MMPEGVPQRTARRERERRNWCICLALMVLSALIALWTLPKGPQLARAAVNLARFGVFTSFSLKDADGDFLDDYTDILVSARQYINTDLVYDSAYFGGGYPPDGHGVCADVIWRALRGAGYDFKAMLDADIAAHPSAYPLPNGYPDPNIDFRRVVNLEVYFKRYCQALTTDPADIGQWQMGDFVIYEGHVAVVSDRRNDEGRPWVIHHRGAGAFEEDALDYKRIIGHYRWRLSGDAVIFR